MFGKGWEKGGTIYAGNHKQFEGTARNLYPGRAAPARIWREGRRQQAHHVDGRPRPARTHLCLPWQALVALGSSASHNTPTWAAVIHHINPCARVCTEIPGNCVVTIHPPGRLISRVRNVSKPSEPRQPLEFAGLSIIFALLCAAPTELAFRLSRLSEHRLRTWGASPILPSPLLRVWEEVLSP